jgi:exopolysaccharide transport family protein
MERDLSIAPRERPSAESIEVRTEAPPRLATRRIEHAAAFLEPEQTNLRSYWQVLRKRRWTVALLFAVVFTGVLLATLKQKPVFRARTLLEIQKENPEIPTVQELFELETVSDAYLETQYKVLKSDTLARRVISELRLDARPEFNPPLPWWSFARAAGEEAGPSGTVTAGAAEREAVQRTLETFQKRLAVEPVKRSRLVAVNFESTDAPLAARAANTLASKYIEQNLEARWEATQKATEWLSQQLTGLKAKLEKSEEELQGYARANGLLFLETGRGAAENIVNERLRQLQEELTRAQAVRFEREALFRLVESGETASLPGVLDSKLMQDLTVRLAELRREQAQLLVTFTPEYPRVRQVQNQMDEIENVIAREQARAAERIRNEYAAALRREKLLELAFAGQQHSANQIAEKSVQYNILKREVDTNRGLYEGLLQRLKEAGVSAGLKASNIRVVDAADAPRKPARPQVVLNLTLGLVGGLLLGVGAAFLQEHLDDTLKTTEDVERFLSMPALGLIPAVASSNGHRRSFSLPLAGLRDLPRRGESTPGQGSALATVAPSKWFRIDAATVSGILPEAFRALRTSVLLSAAGRPPRTLLITSAQVGEGKTTVAVNLAISLAQLGQRVLLVDGDLRRPSAHKVFGQRDAAGLVSYLTGQRPWSACVHRTGIEGLDALFCGPIPPDPAELLSSQRMREFVSEAARSYSFVVLDSAPLMNLADSRILATLAEGIVLVVKGGFTPRELSRRALSQLEDVGGAIIGVVLNGLQPHHGDSSYYYYSYGYRYGDEASRERDA